MGRTKGDAARSKARASSSSLAASLLQTPVNAAVGFGGFVGSARVDLPTPTDGEHLQDVDGDAFLHLKRLSKKDPTTKLKALVALRALFEERPSTEVSALISPWLFEYKKLVQDSSRQVRQATHVAMTSFATCVGRGLAPHLRSLMGPWWISRFDPSREVSEAAKVSFQVAFSGQKKRLEALVFCESEIFNHLDENLKVTPQTIIDKATPVEESIEKFERVVSCSLLASAALIDCLVGPISGRGDNGNTAENVDEAAILTRKARISDDVRNLCRRHRFLQPFLKSKASRVRSAAYQALRSYIQHVPEVFTEEDMDIVVPSILGTFVEKDPACHQHMWDMVLLFTKAFPQSWGYATVRKAVFPQLWSILRHGCYGSPQISYPYVLLLISLIPPTAVLPSQNFLLNLFSNLWQGQTAPQFAAADFTALLKAVQECLIWCILNAERFSDSEGYEAVQLQVALIDGVLVKLMWHSFIGGHLSQETSLLSSVVDSSPTDLSGSTTLNKSSGVNVREASLNRFKPELGSCIVQTIQLISGHADDVMGRFWNDFQESCFQIILEAGKRWQSKKEEDPRIARIADFFLVLGSKTSQGEDKEQWSFTHIVRPFVASSFPLIRSMGDPGSIRLLAKLTSTYGPSAFSLLSVSDAQNDKTDTGQHLQYPVDTEDLREFFKKDIVPWCLAGDDSLNGPKAELILAFIENVHFRNQWEFVISHVTGWEEEVDSKVHFRQAGVLATLLENLIKRKNAISTSKAYLLKGDDTKADWWKSSRIDKAALKVVSSNHLVHLGCVRLLRIALGGTNSEQPLSPIVTDEALIEILNCVLLRLLGVISAQATKWTRCAPSFLMDMGAADINEVSEYDIISDKNVQVAMATVNIFGDCIFSLLSLYRDHTISGKLLAAMFCLKWAYSSPDDSSSYKNYDSTKESDTDLEDGETEFGFDIISTIQRSNVVTEVEVMNVSSRTLEVVPFLEPEDDWRSLKESILSIWQKATPDSFSRFTALTRLGLRQILMKCIRVAVLDEESETPQLMARRCAGWAQEVVNLVCKSPDEVSEFVDVLLARADSWPLWVVASPPQSNRSGRYLSSWNVQQNVSDFTIQRHGRFAAFVDHLSRILTKEEVFLGSQLETEISKEDNLLEKSARDAILSAESCRTWVVVELLGTWEWPGGSALSQVLPYLWSLSRFPKGSREFNLIWGTIQGLFVGSSNSSGSNLIAYTSSSAEEDDSANPKEPFLRALLVLLRGLFEKEDGWSGFDARALFRLFVTKQEDVDFVSPICDVQMLPHVLAVMMPTLRKRSIESTDTSSEEEWRSFLQTAVSVWVQKALTGPPLVAFEPGAEVSGYQWVKIGIACFPLNPAGGAAAMAAASSVLVTSQERELLLALLRKQYSYEAIRAVAAFAAAERISHVKQSQKMKNNKGVEVTLGKLVAVALGYCWLDFEIEEWDFVLKKVRDWLQEAVIQAEEFTEAVVDIVKKAIEMPELAGAETVTAFEKVAEKRDCSVQLYSVAVGIFSLLRGLDNLEKADSTNAIAKLKGANWEIVEMRVLEDVLRLLFSIGLAESSAATSNAGEKGAEFIASQRQLQSQLWDSVADVALGASHHARQAAIRAVDLWGVGKGAISALYALLFSPKPTTSLLWVAYEFLSTSEVLPLAISFGIVVGAGETRSPPEEGSIVEGEVQNDGEVKNEEVKEEDTQGPAQIAQIRPELASSLEMNPSVILQSPLTSPLRVSYLLGWSLLLTRLQSLTTVSRTRELLVQYVQDSDILPTLLDCLFQYIPQEQKLGISGSRRRNRIAKVATSSAAASATRAVSTGSVAFAVEGVWPVQKESLVTLAGALYGLILLVLPACVRIWFTGLRDKSLASAIEAFTTTHCSPQLLADEFGQVQAVNVENLSIRSNRTLREVTAIYQKEEAAMDITIRTPSCYPLRAVEVECTRRLGINETLLRKWILSMAAFLRNQNGAIAEAVQMWKKNVDREFEGVEECPICYSIIHTSDHSLPRLACKTCRHKFHSACLYKWFSTSHQATCPLCKSTFK